MPASFCKTSGVSLFPHHTQSLVWFQLFVRHLLSFIRQFKRHETSDDAAFAPHAQLPRRRAAVGEGARHNTPARATSAQHPARSGRRPESHQNKPPQNEPPHNKPTYNEPENKQPESKRTPERTAPERTLKPDMQNRRAVSRAHSLRNGQILAVAIPDALPGKQECVGGKQVVDHV